MRNRGFTLVEIMIVIAILGLLAGGMVVPNMLRSRMSVELSLCAHNRQLIEKMEQLYRARESGHSQNLQDLVTGGYLNSLPRCPAGGTYAWAPFRRTSTKYQTVITCSVHGGAVEPIPIPIPIPRRLELGDGSPESRSP